MFLSAWTSIVTYPKPLSIRIRNPPTIRLCTPVNRFVVIQFTCYRGWPVLPEIEALKDCFSPALLSASPPPPALLLGGQPVRYWGPWQATLTRMTIHKTDSPTSSPEFRQGYSLENNFQNWYLQNFLWFELLNFLF